MVVHHQRQRQRQPKFLKQKVTFSHFLIYENSEILNLAVKIKRCRPPSWRQRRPECNFLKKGLFAMFHGGGGGINFLFKKSVQTN